MKHSKSNSIARPARAAATLVLGLAISSVLGLNAQAGEIRRSKDQDRSVYLVKYQVGKDVRYGKPSRKAMRVTASNYMRSNPYVCTPSGFGQKARCFTSRQPSV